MSAPTPAAGDARAERRVAASTLVAAIAFAAAYLAGPIFHAPILQYDPVRRLFLFARSAPPPAMSYFGFVLDGLVGATIGFLAAWGWTRHRDPTARTLTVLAGVALVLVAADLAYFTAGLF